MSFAKTMDMNLNTGGKSVSASGMSALHTLKGLTFETPRLLSASEIELLRQAKAEIAARVEQLSGVPLVREEPSPAAA
jgi:hypothetical protein